jgi:endonuclease/exonuclease/phosphatase family metal-dependent hydrolase
MIVLEDHVRSIVDAGDEDRVILLGDFNEILSNQTGRDVFAPFLDAPADYDVATDELGTNGGYTYIPSKRMLDHMLTTQALGGDVSGGPFVRPLEAEVSVYLDMISDHRPVALSFLP